MLIFLWQAMTCTLTTHQVYSSHTLSSQVQEKQQFNDMVTYTDDVHGHNMLGIIKIIISL